MSGWARLIFFLVLAACARAQGSSAPGGKLDLSTTRFVFVKTPRLSFTRQFELRHSAADTNLYTVRGDGTDVRAITRVAQASVRRPAVSFDGKRILFSMNPRGRHGRWHIYECRADGSELRQLTDGPCDDIEPFYLPDGRIGFLSTRPGILDEYHREPATLLHTMAADGSDVRQISFNLSHDLNPRVFSDGRIYYFRWEHRNFRVHRFPIFSVRPDGTELFSYFGLRMRSIGSREFCELPGGRLLLVMPPGGNYYDRSNASSFGRLVIADPALGMDSPLHTLGGRPEGWVYRSPSLLPDGRIVAARARGDLEAPVEGGIVVLSPDGGAEQLLYDDPRMVELFPQALVARQPPAQAPSYVARSKTTGTIAAISVSRSELRHFNGSLLQPMGFLARCGVRAIRVVEGVGARVSRPRSASVHGRGFTVPLNAEMSLGEAPVYPDGSFHVEVPAGRALIFQALDENGMNLSFQSSWVNVMPGEQRLCMGCHEHRDHAPLNRMPLALGRPPTRLAGHREPVSYLGNVAPIVERKCLGCHAARGGRTPAAGLDLSVHHAGHVPWRNATQGPIADRIVPHYARDSCLIWKLYGRALSDGSTIYRVHKRKPRFTYRGGKMPPSGAPRLTEDELRTFVLWVELGAYYRSFPSHPSLPPETPGPAARPAVVRIPPNPLDRKRRPPDDDLGPLLSLAATHAEPPAPKPRRSAPAAPKRTPAPPPTAKRTARIAALPVDRSYDYKSPIRLCLKPDGSRLFVSNHTAGSISVVDTTSNRVVREIPVGAEPIGLAVSPDGRTLYVAVRGEHAVAVVDTEEGKVARRVRVGYEPYGLCLCRKGTLLLVTNSISNDVSVIDTRSLREMKRVPVSREPRSVAVAPDERLALVGNALSPEPATKPDIAAVVSVIDLKERRLLGEVRTIDGNALRDIVVAPDGRHAYVVHQVPRFNVPTTQLAQGWIQTNGLSVIELGRAPRLAATVLLDTFTGGAANPCGVAVTADSRTLYVSHTGTHQITVVDLPRLHALIGNRPEEARRRGDASLTGPRDLARDFGALPRAGVLRRWEAGGLGPRGIALAPRGDRLYVANFFSDTVTVLETRTGQLLDAIRIGREKPMSTVRRGHFLFHDARRSCFQRWLSCASCHPEAGADGLNWDLLNDGIGNRKNAKMLIGAYETPPVMSTGVRPNMETAVAKGFRFIQFRQHTPEEQHAVVEYLKWVRHRPSPFHRLPDGSLDPAAQRGKKLFEDPRIGCARCHPAPLFTDKTLYDVGTRGADDRRDMFDTPSLRELYRTAPYLHDGRAATLGEALTTFNPGDRHGRTSHLSPDRIADLVAYLKSL